MRPLHHPFSLPIAGAFLLCVGTAHAQLTWKLPGSPPPPRTPGLIANPLAPSFAMWDETRNRVRCQFATTTSGYTSLGEFDGTTWMAGDGPPWQPPFPAPLDYQSTCPDPRGGGRHVIFGGVTAFYVSDDTWIWNAASHSYQVAAPAHRPPRRAVGTMALLPGVGSVLFGGGDFATQWTDETWIWDGVDWHQALPATRPSPRNGVAMALDPIANRLVLFGGVNGAGNLADTWTFDGTNWTQLQPAHSPPGGLLRTMVADPVRHEIVLFGGTDVQTNRNDTWTWDGSDWHARTPAHSPPARTRAMTVWDTAAQRVVMVSGFAGGATSLPDSWAWNGTDWTPLPNSGQFTFTWPPERSLAAFAYSSVTGKSVLFGGLDYFAAHFVSRADTWESAGRTWQARSGAVSPPAARGAATILRSTGDLYFYPGAFGSTTLSEQWNWGGQQWSMVPLSTPAITPLVWQVAASLQSSWYGWVVVRLVTSGTSGNYTSTLQLVQPFSGAAAPIVVPGAPSPRNGCVMVQSHAPNVAADRVWLFGGRDGAGTYQNDVWQLADAGGGNFTWTQQVPIAGPAPSPRMQAAVALDGNNRLWVMGGINASGQLGDTWSFDLTSRQWTQLTGPGPSARSGAGMTYDASLGQIVLLGGFDGSNVLADIWECNGTSWTQRVTPGEPPPRRNATMVFDRANQRNLLYSGLGGQSLGDLWSYDGTTWRPLVGQGTQPPARSAHVATFDEAHGSMVVFGGTQNQVNGLGDTWRLDATMRWTPGATGPAARYLSAMTYAILQGTPCSILFGGRSNLAAAPYGDAWKYDLTTNSWQPIASGPPARDQHGLAWDRLRNVVVLFGGRGAGGVLLDDTWELNLATAAWSQRFPAHRPSARRGHALAGDEGRARTVVIGGFDAVGYRNDVWDWNGVDWEARSPESGPPSPREGAAATYDATRGTLQYLGGFDGTSPLPSLMTLGGAIDTTGPGNTTNREGLRFYSQPAVGRTLQLGFANPILGLLTVGFGPLQQPLAPLPVPPLCEPSDIYAAVSSHLVLGTTEPNIAWPAPNTPLLLGAALVFQGFAAQPAGCWRATDALHVRF